MQGVFEAFKGRAEVLFVYIREAHPADSNWADPELDVNDPTTTEERAGVAGKCAGKLGLGMRTVVDGVDDVVNMKYGAWPERMYVIDAGGVIRYKGGIGPFGFKPREAREALEKLLK